MNSYAEIDGLPVAADAGLLTTLLREPGASTGTVVADYFAVAFLQTLHGVAADLGEAAAPGPARRDRRRAAHRQRLPRAAARGGDAPARVPEAARRPGARAGAPPEGAAGPARPRADDVAGPRRPIDLDPPEARATARRLAEESVVLLQNDGVLPLAPRRPGRGHRAERRRPPTPCSAATPSPATCSRSTPAPSWACTAPTVLEALRAEGRRRRGPRAGLRRRRRRTPTGSPPRSSSPATPTSPWSCVGDRAGLFGRGTSGEGCDADSLELPGVQRQLVEARAGDVDPGGAGADDRPPLRDRLGRRPGRRRRPGLLPRPGRGHRGGGRAHRPGQPVGPAAGQHDRRGRRAAVQLPAPAARGPDEGQQPRPDAGLRLRARAELHRRSPTPTWPPSRRCPRTGRSRHRCG